MKRVEAHHQNRKPQIRYAAGTRSVTAPGQRTHASPPAEADSTQDHSRLRIKRHRRRYSYRGAKAATRALPRWSNSRLHLRRELVEIGRSDLDAIASPARIEERCRPGSE